MNAQELIIGHLLPIAATVGVLWLVYCFLFRNSNRLYFNRFFLLTSMLLALAMPLLGLLSGIEVPQMATLKQNMFNGMMLSEVIVTPNGQPVLPEVTVTTDATPSRFSVWQVIGGIYLLGVGVMTLLFLIKLGRLVALIIRSPKRKMDGCTAVFTGRDQGSFSFFRYAFFPNENVDPDIMRHEMSHIEHHHSWDILFAEMMMILNWFNPFIYLYKKELQSLHEYQADRDVVATGVDKKNYMMLILQQCTAVDFSGMSNNFSLILTKKRIKMITRNEKAKGLWWRLLATLPVLAILMIANTKVTAQEKQVNPNPPVDTDTYQIVMYEYDDEDRIPVNDTVMMNEDGSYTEIKREPEVDPETGKMRTKVSFATYDKDGNPAPGGFHIKSEPGEGDGVVYHITPQQGFRFLAEPDNDSIYQIVEQMPKFPGGESALMEYVGKNVVYPEEAKEKEIQGRVFIGFVVEKDGSIGEVKVLRGIGGGCDEEAVRVIKGMPKWKPGIQEGKPVRVSYQIPIYFKLDGSQKSNSLVGSVWEGTGTGTKGGVTYTWHSILQFNSENEGLLIEKLVSQKKNEKPVVEFENVAMDFEYAFDGKKTGAITPKNGDGTYMDEQPPEGFILSDDGKTLVLNFYTATDDTGIKFVTYTRR
jgi:TonB family protein